MGELSPKVTERARTLPEKNRRSDSIALPKRQFIAVRRLSGDGLALSVGLAPASSPKGGALGISVRFRLDKQSTMSREQECSAV